MNSNCLWNSNLPLAKIASQNISGPVFVRGKGCRLFDESGRSYLDARGSLWDLTLGYDDANIIAAIKSQLDRLPVCQTIRYDRPSDVALEFATAIISKLPKVYTKVKFGTTGTQAVDTAILLARIAQELRGCPNRVWLISSVHGYHGSGVGPVAVSGGKSPSSFHRPLAEYVKIAKRSHVRQSIVQDMISAADEIGLGNVAAFVVEPIVGTGIQELSSDELRLLRKFANENHIFLIGDEVTTGWGRVGTWSRFAEIGVLPDILLLGKGLTSGYIPCSAVVVHEELTHLFTKCGQGFSVGSTADGNPLAMAAGIAVTRTLEQGSFLASVKSKGEFLKKRIHSNRLNDHWKTRGVGLMCGLEIADQCGRVFKNGDLELVRQRMEAKGVLVHPVDCITFMPPLTISESEIEEIVTVLVDSATGC